MIDYVQIFLKNGFPIENLNTVEDFKNEYQRIYDEQGVDLMEQRRQVFLRQQEVEGNIQKYQLIPSQNTQETNMPASPRKTFDVNYNPVYTRLGEISIDQWSYKQGHQAKISDTIRQIESYKKQREALIEEQRQYQELQNALGHPTGTARWIPPRT